MSDLIINQRDGDVHFITINNPPVNALSPGVPEELAASVEAANCDPEVKAIVVIGGGRTFIAGADIREFGKIVSGERGPIALTPLLKQIEDSNTPVIMAIHGTALGGGLETALAGHYRVASPDAKVGQPEVKLGLIPGAAGTQRLPRLAGIRTALEMCVFGESIGAAAALEAGIIDRIIEGDLLAGAIAFAREVSTAPPPRTRDRAEKLGAPPDAVRAAAEYQAAAEKRLRGQTAPLAAIEAITAATILPFEQGCERERELFEECLYGSQSKALIYAFFGERTVAKLPGLPAGTQSLPLGKAGVVGAGTMGSGIAMSFANAGIPVLLQEASAEALTAGLARIRGVYEGSVRKGRLSEEQAERRMAIITPVESYAGFETADVVVEAVFENLELKKQVFWEIDRAARPGAVLATNTSTLDIDAIAAVTSRPESVVGLHFFSPAQVMRLLEVVRGKATSPEVLATAMELARRLKKVGVVAGNCHGFIGNRMFGPYRTQAVLMVEDGASPWELDQALVDWGMAMGPLAVGDLAGLDVSWRIRQESRGMELPGVRYPEVEDLLYARGRYGQKTGAGWYLYDGQRRPSPDPEVEALVLEYAREQGLPQREFTAQEMVERTIFALVNEGARLLEEGIAARAVDIDMIYLTGYGFPAWRGGPMHYADSLGLANVLARIEQFQRELGALWQPAPLLVRLAGEGRRFSE
jgi:3-hydroxyacyl-CoA dehydrogenase